MPRTVTICLGPQLSYYSSNVRDLPVFLCSSSILVIHAKSQSQRTPIASSQLNNLIFAKNWPHLKIPLRKSFIGPIWIKSALLLQSAMDIRCVLTRSPRSPFFLASYLIFPKSLFGILPLHLVFNFHVPADYRTLIFFSSHLWCSDLSYGTHSYSVNYNSLGVNPQNS